MTTMEAVVTFGVAGVVSGVVINAGWDVIKWVLSLVREWLLPFQASNGYQVAQMISAYLDANGRRLANGFRVWESRSTYIRPEKRKRWLFFWTLYSQEAVWLYRGTLIMHARRGGTPDQLAGFRHIRGTLNWERLLKDVEDWNAKQGDAEHGETGYQVIRASGSGGFAGGRDMDRDIMAAKAVHAPTSYPQSDADAVVPLSFDRSEIGAPIPESPFSLYAESDASRALVADFAFWWQSRAWYRSRDIPWRRGYMLQGPPGCGKTSLVRAVAQKFDVKVVIWDLGSFGNDDFLSRLRFMAESETNGVVFLFEDIDCVFHGRENISKGGGGLTFDCLLNALDGVDALEGVCVVMTTNHPEVLDPALTRDGRVDLTVELPGLTIDARRFIAHRIIDDPSEADAAVKAGAADATPAAFKGRCIARALELRWKGARA